MTKAYEDELRIYEARERLELSKLRAKAKEKVSEALRKRLNGILKYLKVTVHTCYPSYADKAFQHYSRKMTLLISDSALTLSITDTLLSAYTV